MGMRIHAKEPGSDKESKSVCIFVRGKGNTEEADTSDIELEDGRFIPFKSEVVYLGTVIHESLDDRHAVEARIVKASRIFGSLRGAIFGRKRVPMRVKKQVYISCVLSTLLYGCECWTLTEASYDRLRTFHADKIRIMTATTTHKMIRYHISNAQLRARTKISPIDSYVAHRAAMWAGHVGRMNNERLPRRMMFAWVRKARMRGRPEMTYGATLAKHLRRFDIPVEAEEWVELAKDRVGWRARIQPGKHSSTEEEEKEKERAGKRKNQQEARERGRQKRSQAEAGNRTCPRT